MGENSYKVLIVTQEMKPYTAISEISDLVRQLPDHLSKKGTEIRILMPRFGTINERRHRLHEVVRLSGMNIIVDNDDYPLIIKVASLPGAKMQVYFLDNEEFFKRKSVFEDAEGVPHEDNVDRMVFFCKGVLETIKKFGWPPDIIHCHGWMTSLVPFYLKQAYQKEPLFSNTKVVYSLYGHDKGISIGDSFFNKASINQLKPEDLQYYKNGKGISLDKGAIHYADGLVVGSELVDKQLIQEMKDADKKTVEFQEESALIAACFSLYNELQENSL
jgi:starch synthase